MFECYNLHVIKSLNIGSNLPKFYLICHFCASCSNSGIFRSDEVIATETALDRLDASDIFFNIYKFTCSINAYLLVIFSLKTNFEEITMKNWRRRNKR